MVSAGSKYRSVPCSYCQSNDSETRSLTRSIIHMPKASTNPLVATKANIIPACETIWRAAKPP